MTETAVQRSLPVGARGKSSSGWWGVWMLIVTEGSLFGYLLLSYYYLWSQTHQSWPPDGPPKLLMPGINTVILLSSSVFVWFSERNIRRDRKKAGMAWLGLAIAAGAAFVGIQLREWHTRSYGPSAHLYGSLYYTITGFHMLHVVVGLVVLSFLLLWTGLGYFNSRRAAALSIGGIYWHFVDAVWIAVFSTFFLVPYLK